MSVERLAWQIEAMTRVTRVILAARDSSGRGTEGVVSAMVHREVVLGRGKSLEERERGAGISGDGQAPTCAPSSFSLEPRATDPITVFTLSIIQIRMIFTSSTSELDGAMDDKRHDRRLHHLPSSQKGLSRISVLGNASTPPQALWQLLE